MGFDATTPASKADAGSADEPAVVVEGLTKRYGARTVVDDVALEVRRGRGRRPRGAQRRRQDHDGRDRRGVPAARRRCGVRVLGIDPWAAGRRHRGRVGLMLQAGGIDQRARPAETLHQYAAFGLTARPRAAGAGARSAGPPWRPHAGLFPAGNASGLGARARVGRASRVTCCSMSRPPDGSEAPPESGRKSEAERQDGTAVSVTTHELTEVEISGRPDRRARRRAHRGRGHDR